MNALEIETDLSDICGRIDAAITIFNAAAFEAVGESSRAANALSVILDDLSAAADGLLRRVARGEGQQALHWRLDEFARAKGVTPPACIMYRDGAPADELLTFCRTHGLSLDWLFLGRSGLSTGGPSALAGEVPT